MKYQQIHTSRLSAAAEKLVRDGQWHVYATDDRAYYRVIGKVVQRVRLEAGEDNSLLKLFDGFAPLPRRVFKEGYREEVTLRVDDDVYALRGMYLRSFMGWDLLARAGESFGIRIGLHAGNSIEFCVTIEEWSTRQLLLALVTARAYAQVGTSLVLDAREGIPHTEAEIRGLIRTARDLLLEEIGDVDPKPLQTSQVKEKAQKISKGARHAQPSLFADPLDGQ